MSTRGGGFGSGSRGRGGRGGFGRGGSRGGFGARNGSFENAPPGQLQQMGMFMHACEGDMVCKSVNEMIPYFNAPIYLENKTQIGRVDEILGPINQVYFTVKVMEGVVAGSFKENDKVFITSDKLLPLERFLPKPKAPKVKGSTTDGGRGRGRGRGRGAGGFGGRGRGAARGGRGGFSSRGGSGGGGSGRGRGRGRGGY